MTRHGAGLGAVPKKHRGASPIEPGKAPSDNHLEDSRGGTRTRDPGIMSAVL